MWEVVLGAATAVLVYRRLRRRHAPQLLPRRDRRFVHAAIDASLKVLGLALQPAQGRAEPARARAVDFIRNQGERPAATVALMAFGMAENHFRRRRQTPMAIARVTGGLTDRVAQEFKLRPANLWDLQNRLRHEVPEAQWLFEQASLRSLSMRRDARHDERLRRAVLAVAGGARAEEGEAARQATDQEPIDASQTNAQPSASQLGQKRSR